ncbi:F-box domain-containing protein [Mycena venus]|uniref:F-box domain-containing protein n=1 Tax=Mycena venus TaxID=2733690 RepID=A0A8H6WY04_9AGAR|nr:F-box domain-containing protein [Mycena venus]
MMESIHLCPNCLNAFDEDPPLNPTLVSSDILESNEPPPDSQIPLLRDFITKGLTRMDSFNAKIRLLQSSLDRLLEEKNELEIEIEKHRASLSPLRRMPPEILSLMFAFALPPFQPDAEPAPWTVSAVCARWRATTLSQPVFWTFVDLNGPFTNRYRLETQLERSGDLPLNVKYSSSKSSTYKDMNLAKIICPHARRWEVITMFGPQILYSQFRAGIQAQLALLRELNIEMVHWHSSGGNDIPSLDMFSDAPLLQGVVANKTLWQFPLAMELPWSQLLRFGGSNTWEGHLHALHSATNLVDCTLEIQGMSGLPPTPIILPHLLRLSLSNPAFLGCLETPALLELYCGYASPVLSFIRRRSCKLKSLVLHSGPAYDDGTDLACIVNVVPTITKLALLFYFPANFFLGFCSLALAPALECFSFIGDMQHHFIEAIEQRWYSGRLKSVKVECSHSRVLAPEICDRIALLQAQGQEFVVFPSSNALCEDIIPSRFTIKSH